MRVITLDSNKIVISVKTVGDSYVLETNDIATDLGELGQIQQADGSFITPPPPIPTLQDAQQAKIIQLNSSYNQTLASGFTSSASSTPLSYAYDSSSQSKFLKLQISVLSGLVTWPVPIPIKGGTIVPHTQAQFQQLLVDINTFEWTQQNKLHTKLGQVSAALNVTDVNKINW